MSWVLSDVAGPILDGDDGHGLLGLAYDALSVAFRLGERRRGGHGVTGGARVVGNWLVRLRVADF